MFSGDRARLRTRNSGIVVELAGNVADTIVSASIRVETEDENLLRQGAIALRAQAPDWRVSLPAGEYTLELTTESGESYTVEAEVSASAWRRVQIVQR